MKHPLKQYCIHSMIIYVENNQFRIFENENQEWKIPNVTPLTFEICFFPSLSLLLFNLKIWMMNITCMKHPPKKNRIISWFETKNKKIWRIIASRFFSFLNCCFHQTKTILSRSWYTQSIRYWCNIEIACENDFQPKKNHHNHNQYNTHYRLKFNNNLPVFLPIFIVRNFFYPFFSNSI